MDNNYEFELIDEFGHYISSRDKTNLAPNFFVKNSKNIIKKITGTIANRPGLLAYGPLDTTVAGVVATYVWNNSFAKTRVLRVTSDGRLSVLFTLSNQTMAWYDLMTSLTKTRFIFDSWFEFDEQKDRVVMVIGDANIYHWSGGIAQTGATTTLVPTIASVAINAAGGQYNIGDLLTINQGGNTSATIKVSKLAGGFVTSVIIVNAGSGYSTANGLTTTAQTGLGTGLTVNIVVSNTGTIATQDGSTWISNGFASLITSEMQFKALGVTYTYTGVNGSTLTGVTPDPTAIPAGTVAIQNVQTASTFTAGQNAYSAFSIPGPNDFIRILNGQLFLASFTSRNIYISAQAQTGIDVAFTDFSNKGDLIPGDPDLVTLDNCPTGMIPKEGHMYISAGTSDWYVVTPNTPIPISVPLTGSSSPIRLVVTSVQKVPGTGLVAALAPEFIENYAGDIIYLSQDHQLRKLGTFPNILNVVKFPSLSQDTQDEFRLENFTGGHLRGIGEFIYLTAPLSGKHYLYQIRESIDMNGRIVTERIWHSPQVSAISRFEAIAGIVYGFSNLNPMTYQIWDTGQWHDDSPTGDQLPYECVLAMAYRQLPNKSRSFRRQGKIVFDKIYFEGYMSRGTPLYAKVYFDYQGASDIQTLYINSPKVPAVPVQPLPTKDVKLYTYADAPNLEQDLLADNPIGTSIFLSADSQDYLPKFRAIRKVNPVDCFEFGIEVYSYEIDARWEILALGPDMRLAQRVPRELL